MSWSVSLGKPLLCSPEILWYGLKTHRYDPTLLCCWSKSETISLWEDLESFWKTATDTPLPIFSVSLGLGNDRSDSNGVISPVRGLTSQGKTHACQSPGRALWILPSKQNGDGNRQVYDLFCIRSTFVCPVLPNRRTTGSLSKTQSEYFHPLFPYRLASHGPRYKHFSWARGSMGEEAAAQKGDHAYMKFLCGSAGGRSDFYRSTRNKKSLLISLQITAVWEKALNSRLACRWLTAAILSFPGLGRWPLEGNKGNRVNLLSR